jgi:hypothetical protein
MTDSGRKPEKCEHLVMIMLPHSTCAKGWVCRDCGENVTRDGGYIIGLVALKVRKP